MNTHDKKIRLTDKISREEFSTDESMDLNSCYEQTVAELGLQQTKRDQIIAFYLTILSFVIPSVISLEISNAPKAVAFEAMYVIGIIFSHVILRYRIYKEVYWIACRVIAKMHRLSPENRTKKNIYILFYNVMKENHSVVVYKNNKVSILSSMKKQINSAETLLYETPALFASFVGAIGGYYAFTENAIVGVAIWCVVVLAFGKINYAYTAGLLKLYAALDEENEEEKLRKLESTFEKAWMLDCYVDDVEEE